MKGQQIAVLAGLALLVAARPALAFDPYGFLTAQNGDFGLVDLATGAFTLCGNSGQTLAGLAFGPNGNLYALSFESGGSTSTLYVVRPRDGHLTAVGTPAIPSAVLYGSSAHGQFAVDSAGDLFSIDPTSATATKIGPTGVTISGTVSISNDAAALYVTQDTNFYVVDTKTGAATKLGTGSVSIDAMVMSGKTLIGAAPAPVTLQKIKPKSGADHRIAKVPGEPSSFQGLIAYPGQNNGVCPP